MAEVGERYPHRYKPIGDKAFCRKPVCVLLPPELDEYVRSLPNRTEWLRQAIMVQIDRDRSSISQNPEKNAET